MIIEYGKRKFVKVSLILKHYKDTNQEDRKSKQMKKLFYCHNRSYSIDNSKTPVQQLTL